MKEELKENKVIINESGDVEILLTEEAQKLGHVSIEEGKRLIKSIIQKQEILSMDIINEIGQDAYLFFDLYMDDKLYAIFKYTLTDVTHMNDKRIHLRGEVEPGEIFRNNELLLIYNITKSTFTRPGGNRTYKFVLNTNTSNPHGVHNASVIERLLKYEKEYTPILENISVEEAERHSLIKACAQELLNETGGFSSDVNKRVEKIKDPENTAREKLLSYFANEPFVFTTEQEHSNTHIIQYTVQNIAAIRNNEVLLEGEWFDTDTNEKITKRIRVNCDTKSVMYYNPFLRSNHAQLNPNTYTKSEWDKFVEELTKLRDESRKQII